MAARRKMPNQIDTTASTVDFVQRMQWLVDEYKMLANKRNTLAFCYNEKLKLLSGDAHVTFEMLEWRKECQRLEVIMQWISEVYHAQSARALQQSKMDV